ncbi:MAG: flagellar hook capping protein [Planctomycetaceae bacterium]|nr:flagellar hook capping protein [Planctomycetaceae bacterium]
MATTGGVLASGATYTPPEIKIVDRADTGFNSLNAESFLKMLIVELQNQDPTAPMGNEELLNQLSTMRGLTANIELEDAMKSLNSNQQLSTAASFIGKNVTATMDNSETFTGVVDRAFLREGKTYIASGTTEIPVSSITGIKGA